MDFKSEQSRTFIAILLSTVLFFAWSFFNPPAPVQKTVVAENIDKASVSEKSTVAEVNEKKVLEADALSNKEMQAIDKTNESQAEQKIQHLILVKNAKDSDLASVLGDMQIELSNKGGQISRLELTGYGDTDAAKKGVAKEDLKPVDLAKAVFPEGVRQFSLVSRTEGDLSLKADATYDVLSSSDKQSVIFQRKDISGIHIKRQYDFKDGNFGFEHRLILENTADTPKTIALNLMVSAAKNPKASGGGFMGAGQRTVLSAACASNEEHILYSDGDIALEASSAELHMNGPIVHAAASLQYFMASVIPLEKEAVSGCQVRTFAIQENAEDKKTDAVETILEYKTFVLAPHTQKIFSQKTYFGPKQLQLLKAQGANLDQNVDFGFFGVLSKPFLSVLMFLQSKVGNFGIAIILLTILIKLLTFPLTQKSYSSMQHMKILAPEIAALKEKYGHDRALMGQKQMEMYKEKGVNPMAGCLPMLIQMPVWFALYRTFWASVELYQQPFFGWIQDLAQPDYIDAIGMGVLPFIVGALMFLQTTMSPPPQDQPQMKYVMWFMPIMFTFFMFSMPSGLALYMITNSSLTFVQQLYIKKKFAAKVEAAA